MAIENSIDRLRTNVSAALSAIAEKGVDVTGADSDDLAALIALISGGGGYTNGEFTVAASSGAAEAVTVTHDLGKIPDIAVAINSSLAAQQSPFGIILVYAYIAGVSYSAVSKNSNSITVTKSTRADITAANTGFGSATEEEIVFKRGGSSGSSMAKTYYYILGAI